MKKVLVTGATGFIGSYVIAALQKMVVQLLLLLQIWKKQKQNLV